MKKILLILVIILAATCTWYIYSFARSKISMPRAEDSALRQSSAFMPQKTEEGKPASKGSSELQLTGPVWVEK